MEKWKDEMWIPRYKAKSVAGDYDSVELIKTISHASHLKVHHSFLMLCTGPVTWHLRWLLGLLGKIQNNVAKCSTGLLSLKRFVFFVEKFLLNLNAGGRQGPAWIPGQHLPKPHFLPSPLAWLLQHCLQQPSVGIALLSMAANSSSFTRGCQKRQICFSRVSYG